jgi:hypothetical protein
VAQFDNLEINSPQRKKIQLKFFFDKDVIRLKDDKIWHFFNFLVFKIITIIDCHSSWIEIDIQSNVNEVTNVCWTLNCFIVHMVYLIWYNSIYMSLWWSMCKYNWIFYQYDWILLHIYLWRFNFNLHGRILVNNLMAILLNFSWWCKRIESFGKEKEKVKKAVFNIRKWRNFAKM